MRLGASDHCVNVWLGLSGATGRVDEEVVTLPSRLIAEGLETEAVLRLDGSNHNVHVWLGLSDANGRVDEEGVTLAGSIPGDR